MTLIHALKTPIKMSKFEYQKSTSKINLKKIAKIFSIFKFLEFGQIAFKR